MGGYYTMISHFCCSLIAGSPLSCDHLPLLLPPPQVPAFPAFLASSPPLYLCLSAIALLGTGGLLISPSSNSSLLPLYILPVNCCSLSTIWCLECLGLCHLHHYLYPYSFVSCKLFEIPFTLLFLTAVHH